jgi:hypothetical protein
MPVLRGVADAFAIAIKRRNEKLDLIHLKPSPRAAIRKSRCASIIPL